MGTLVTGHAPPHADAAPSVASRRALLVCGVAAALTYGAMNAFIPLLWPEYHVASQTVSELSAIDAPTRPLWFGLGLVYTALYAAFGIGVLHAARGARSLRVAGALIVACAVVGLYWPPMHLRSFSAVHGATLTDTLHIVWTAAWGLLSMTAMGFAAAAFGKRFRLFTALSVAVMIGFGMLTSREAPNVPIDLPTPTIGVWERINIGMFYAWVIAFAASMLRRERVAAHPEGDGASGVRLGALIKVLVGAGDRIMLAWLPFAALGIAANVVWPALFRIDLGTVGLVTGVVLLAMGVPMWIGSAAQILIYVPKKKLITTGPFAILVHPLYTSVALLVIPGVGLLLGSWLGAALGAILYLASRRFAPAEERDLEKQFPDEYPAYRRRVLLPWL